MANVNVNNLLLEAPTPSAIACIRALRDRLVEERQRRHLSQQALANLMGVSRSAISDFERMPERSGVIIAFAYACATGLDIQFTFDRPEGLMAESAFLADVPAWEETP